MKYTIETLIDVGLSLLNVLRHAKNSWSFAITALALFWICAETAAKKAPNDTYLYNERALYQYLKDDYMTAFRPVNYENETVHLEISLSVTSAEIVIEKDQTFMVHGLLRHQWKDADLTWDPKEFGGISLTRIPLLELWYPDLTVSNSKDPYYMTPTHHLAVVNYVGVVLWFTPVLIETHCSLDMSEFPFDQHTCDVTFMSWVYHDGEVKLTSHDTENNNLVVENTFNKIDHSEWELINLTATRKVRYYSCCVEGYSDITYNFTLKRRDSFTTNLFLAPSVVLCFITPVIFLLPPGSGEKIVFGTGLLIADTLLLNELIDYVPSAHPNIPFIAKYYLGNIIMTSLSLIVSAIIVGFWDKSNSRLTGPPAFFRLFLLGPMANVLCVKKEDYQTMDVSSDFGAVEFNVDSEEGFDLPSRTEPGAERRQRYMATYLRNVAKAEWRQVAVISDRFFLVVYCLILWIITLSFVRYL